MAILWEKKVAGVSYQVRTAGRTRRLYTNGVFHSQYNPANPVGGSVWDLLMLPAFFYPPGSVKRVLVLGVGGGTVIKQLDHFLKPVNLTGVELNPVHLSIAERFFNVSGANIELIRGDAREWINTYQGEKFDLIIDDLFAEVDRQPVRAVAVDAPWVNALTRLLSAHGALVINFESAKALHKVCRGLPDTVYRRFKSVFRLTTSHYENNVGVFFRKKMLRENLISHLSQVPTLDPTRKSCRLKFQLRKLLS